MLRDQVTGQHKRKLMLIRRPRGKAVMSGPGARKDTKERSLRNRERDQDLINIFREGWLDPPLPPNAITYLNAPLMAMLEKDEYKLV